MSQQNRFSEYASPQEGRNNGGPSQSILDQHQLTHHNWIEPQQNVPPPQTVATLSNNPFRNMSGEVADTTGGEVQTQNYP